VCAVVLSLIHKVVPQVLTPEENKVTNGL